jgi:hypothetical protein
MAAMDNLVAQIKSELDGYQTPQKERLLSAKYY